MAHTIAMEQSAAVLEPASNNQLNSTPPSCPHSRMDSCTDTPQSFPRSVCSTPNLSYDDSTPPVPRSVSHKSISTVPGGSPLSQRVSRAPEVVEEIASEALAATRSFSTASILIMFAPPTTVVVNETMPNHTVGLGLQVSRTDSGGAGSDLSRQTSSGSSSTDLSCSFGRRFSDQSDATNATATTMATEPPTPCIAKFPDTQPSCISPSSRLGGHKALESSPRSSFSLSDYYGEDSEPRKSLLAPANIKTRTVKGLDEPFKAGPQNLGSFQVAATTPSSKVSMGKRDSYGREPVPHEKHSTKSNPSEWTGKQKALFGQDYGVSSKAQQEPDLLPHMSNLRITPPSTLKVNLLPAASLPSPKHKASAKPPSHVNILHKQEENQCLRLQMATFPKPPVNPSLQTWLDNLESSNATSPPADEAAASIAYSPNTSPEVKRNVEIETLNELSITESDDLPVGDLFRTLQIWFDQEGFREIAPVFLFTHYQRDEDLLYFTTSRIGFPFHYDHMQKYPTLRKVVAPDYEEAYALLEGKQGREAGGRRDFISKQASLNIKNPGKYIVEATEGKQGKWKWLLTYEVEERQSLMSKPLKGERFFFPLVFACSPEILDPSHARKTSLVNAFLKSVSFKSQSVPLNEAGTSPIATTSSSFSKGRARGKSFGSKASFRSRSDSVSRLLGSPIPSLNNSSIGSWNQPQRSVTQSSRRPQATTVATTADDENTSGHLHVFHSIAPRSLTRLRPSTAQGHSDSVARLRHYKTAEQLRRPCTAGPTASSVNLTESVFGLAPQPTRATPSGGAQSGRVVASDGRHAVVMSQRK